MACDGADACMAWCKCVCVPSVCAYVWVHVSAFVCICVHVLVLSCVHAFVCACTRACVHACPRACVSTCCQHTATLFPLQYHDTQLPLRACACVRAYAHACVRAFARPYVRACAQACRRGRLQTSSHTYIGHNYIRHNYNVPQGSTTNIEPSSTAVSTDTPPLTGV